MSATTADTAVAAEAAPKPAKSKKMIIIAAVAGLAAISGGVYWYLGQRHAATEEEHVVKEEVPPIYVPLENFTVNLQPEIGDQYLQVMLSLKVTDQPTVEKLKVLMPEIRNRLLLLLSSKRASELVSTAGKENLSKEIQYEVSRVVDPALGPAIAKLLAPKVVPGVTVAPAALVVPHAEGAHAEAAQAATAHESADASTETEADAAAETDAQADETAEAEGEGNAAAGEKKVAAPLELPITGVLFTSFIIQ